jgi:hypothetical protein
VIIVLFQHAGEYRTSGFQSDEALYGKTTLENYFQGGVFTDEPKESCFVEQTSFSENVSRRDMGCPSLKIDAGIAMESTASG